MSFLGAIGSVLSPIGTLVDNLAGPILGYKSNKETNQANKEINKMNNDFNAVEAEKAFRRQAEYNDRIRAEDREYNSAEQQVERYRQAGLNPAMMMQGQSAGMAQSNGVSSSAASAAPSAPQQSFTPDFSDVVPSMIQSIDAIKNLRKKELENRILSIDAKYKESKVISELDKLKGEADSAKARGRITAMEEEVYSSSKGSFIDENKAKAQEAKFAAQLREQQYLQEKAISRGIDERIAAELAKIKAETEATIYKSKGAMKDLIDALEAEFGRIPDMMKAAIIAFMKQN